MNAGWLAGQGKVRELTTAQAITLYLQAQFSARDGVERRLVPRIFGIFGHGNVVGFGEALEEYGLDLPFHQPKNEEMMVHAAAGFAKASNRLSTFACSASIGPGSTNMITGAACATANRLPVLLFPSDTFATRAQGVVLQQVEPSWAGDITVNDALRPVSRYFDRINRPEQLLTALPAAMRTLLDQADTGAVTISLPQDVQGEAFAFPAAFFEKHVWHVVRRPPAEEEIAAALDMIQSARRPLIISGGGVRYSEAEQALAEFAALAQIPVAETHAGKGTCLDPALCLGAIGANGTSAANALAHEADLIIAIGTRLTDFITGSNSLFQAEGVRFLGINVSGADAQKMGAQAVVADARETLVALKAGLSGRSKVARDAYLSEAREKWQAWLDAVAADTAPRDGETMSQAQIVQRLNKLATPNDIVVTAAGTCIADVTKLWECHDSAPCDIEFGFSCMGFDIPSAIGVRLAKPDAGEIFVVIGDGNYLLANSELVTAAQEHLKITVILVENAGFQSIHALQKGTTGASFATERRARGADKRLSGDVVAVDFEAHARSLGCHAITADTLDAFEAAVAEARGVKGRPVVIVAPVEPLRLFGADNLSWWDVGVAETSGLQRVNQASERHIQARKRLQRAYL